MDQMERVQGRYSFVDQSGSKRLNEAEDEGGWFFPSLVEGDCYKLATRSFYSRCERGLVTHSCHVCDIGKERVGFFLFNRVGTYLAMENTF